MILIQTHKIANLKNKNKKKLLIKKRKKVMRKVKREIKVRDYNNKKILLNNSIQFLILSKI